MIAFIAFGLLAFHCAAGVEVPQGFTCIGYVADNLCDDGNNGGCGTKHCTFTPMSDVSCSCDTFSASEEDNLLARGKPVTMSSQYPTRNGYSYPGSKAVDGVYAPDGMNELSSIAITKRTTTAWIQIDLEENRCISAVRIWNRTPVADRFQNVLITIGETEEEVANTATDSAAVCVYHPGQPDDVERFDCSSRMFGRYVRVTKLDYYSYLNLYEIQVIGL